MAWAVVEGEGGWWFGLAGILTALATVVGVLWKSWQDRKDREVERKIRAAEAEAKLAAAKHEEDSKIEAAKEEARKIARKDALEEAWSIAKSWQDQAERKDDVVAQYQELYQAVVEEMGDCREGRAEDRGIMRMFYDLLSRAWSILKEKGIDMGQLPEFPPMKDRKESVLRRKFLQGQAFQSRESVKQVDEALKARTPVSPLGSPLSIPVPPEGNK